MDQNIISEVWKTFSQRNYHPMEILKKESYLAFSILFVFLRAFAYLFLGLISKLKVVWVSQSYMDFFRHFNLGIFEGSRQLLHLIDMKWLWSKLWLTDKTRNLQKGANNARVWATSLASVSLGESSASRTSSGWKLLFWADRDFHTFSRISLSNISLSHLNECVPGVLSHFGPMGNWESIYFACKFQGHCKVREVIFLFSPV